MSNDYFNEKIETISRSELENLQLERLKSQVKRCYEKSQFYKEKFKKNNLLPENITKIEDIQKIPFTRKEELINSQRNNIPFGNYIVSNNNWKEIHPTSGTTTTPVHTIWTKKDVKNIKNFTARFLWGMGIREGDIIHNAFDYGLWIAGLAVHYAAGILNCPIIPIGEKSYRRQIDYLVNHFPKALISTPTFCIKLIEKLNLRNLYANDLSLKIGAFGGEPGVEMENIRTKIENGLGIKAYDIFGLGEIAPTMAAECEAQNGLHWAEDHHLVEIIDPDTKEPCDEGEVGVLVITDLTKDTMPLLRYWTNDYACLVKDRCVCGRTHARSPGGILGRHDNLIVYKGQKFYPIEIKKVASKFPWVDDDIKIVLKKENNIVKSVKIIVEKEIENLEGINVEQRLKDVFNKKMNFTPEIILLDKGELNLNYGDESLVEIENCDNK